MYTIIYDPYFSTAFIKQIYANLNQKIQEKIEKIKPKTDEVVFTPSNENWHHLQFPQENYIYIQPIKPHHYVAGNDYDGGIAVGVIAGEDETTISNRLTHEILHDLNLPADDLILHLSELKENNYISFWDYYGIIYFGVIYLVLNRNRIEKAYYNFLIDNNIKD